MSRRARSRHDRRVILNPIEVACNGVQRLDPADRAALQRIVGNAFDEFRRGTRCPEHWACLADSLNVAEALSQAGICSDAASVQRITAARQVLADVRMRHHERNTWTLRAAELQALDDGLLMVRIQIDLCSVREYVDAVGLVKRRVAAALAGNAPAGTLLVDAVPGREGE